MGWRECAWCHKAFHASRSDARFCSDEHRGSMWRLQRRSGAARAAAAALKALSLDELVLVLKQAAPAAVAQLHHDAELVADGQLPGQGRIV